MLTTVVYSSIRPTTLLLILLLHTSLFYLYTILYTFLHPTYILSLLNSYSSTICDMSTHFLSPSPATTTTIHLLSNTAQSNTAIANKSRNEQYTPLNLYSSHNLRTLRLDTLYILHSTLLSTIHHTTPAHLYRYIYIYIHIYIYIYVLRCIQQ
jgi:hypothetical protein